MRVSDSRRVFFVHIPKTGGSSIDAIFDELVPDQRRVEGMQRHATYRRLVKVEPDLTTYWSFAVVRNPWARMVSWYSMFHNFFAGVEAGNRWAVKTYEKRFNHYSPVRPFSDDFDAFVLEGTSAVERLGRPQVKWLDGPEGGVDVVGRLENFAADVDVLRDRLGLAPAEPVPHRNKSPHAHYSQYYNERTRARVAELFAPDVERFGYHYEDRSGAEQ